MVENQRKFLEKNGNKVVLLTDENSLYNVESFILIPDARLANWDKYESRAEEIKKIIQMYNIKICLNMSSDIHNTWLDKLLLKSYGVILMEMNIKDNLLFAIKLFFLKCCEKLEKVVVGEK